MIEEMNKNDMKSAKITLIPPNQGQDSDEDSNDEEDAKHIHFSRGQLIANAEVEIDCTSHTISTFDIFPDNAEVNQPLRRSYRLSKDNQLDDDNEGYCSDDLWGEPETSSVQNSPVPADQVTKNKWLSNQTPPSPPTAWVKSDLLPKDFTNFPEKHDLLTPNGIITPFSLFNLFFDETVINHIVDMTNLYAQRDKNMIDFHTDDCEIKLFLAVLLLSGYNPRPRTKMYFETEEDAACPIVSSLFSRKRFLDLFKCVHLCDNLDLAKNDKMAKVRPFYDLINERFLKFRANSPNLSVDESMIPYYGRNNSKQRIQNKPVRVGYKMWVLAEDSGYVVKFEPYQGAKTTGPQRSTPTTWGLGEYVVLNLLDVLPKGISYHVFFDNFFTSTRLVKFLADNNIRASGTLRRNRIHKTCTIMNKQDVQKQKKRFFRSADL